MKPRVVYVHGNGTQHWSYGWASWLRNQLIVTGYDTFFETMPDSVIAREQFWLPFLEKHVQVGANDIIVGWSSGAVAAMRYAEDHQIHGSVLIAPCYTDLGDAMEKQSGYYDTPWDWSAIRANQKHTALVFAADDPFIPQSEPDVHRLDSGGHFIEQSTFPELLEIIRDMS